MTERFLARVLGVLALIVPARDRARWREEWLAEIEHVTRDRGQRTRKSHVWAVAAVRAQRRQPAMRLR